MKIGDLVRCLHMHENNVGIVVRTDLGSDYRTVKKRYWVLLHGRRSPFTFLKHQLEIISEAH